MCPKHKKILTAVRTLASLLRCMHPVHGTSDFFFLIIISISLFFILVLHVYKLGCYLVFCSGC